MTNFPSPCLRIFLIFWNLLWVLCLPFIIIYFYYCSYRSRLCGAHINERFGFYQNCSEKTVWIHAACLGEIRTAIPLIQEFLHHKKTIVITHATPMGRNGTKKYFTKEVMNGRIIPIYIPFEFFWVYRRFLKLFKPKFGLVIENELWPCMIASAYKYKVPLFICNGQYSERSFKRDLHIVRGHLCRGYTGILAKSQIYAQRFAALGANNITVTGDLRFDMPISKHQIQAATMIAKNTRKIICIASAVQGEDNNYIATYKKIIKRTQRAGLPSPLLVYVPRAPERFVRVENKFRTAGFNVLKRSVLLNDKLKLLHSNRLEKADILIGDSLGEMYFYLAISDIVIVGGGFHAHGAHNIIESLILKKPVCVGPNISSIEYPAQEAITAGVLVHCQSVIILGRNVFNMLYSSAARADFAKQAAQFNAIHMGANKRIFAALSTQLNQKYLNTAIQEQK